METRNPARRLTGKGFMASAASALAIGSLTLSGCAPDAETGGDEQALTIEQSPIMNGYNTTRDQALLTMEVLTITPMSMAGYSEALFETDQEVLASEVGWERSGVENLNCTVPEAALVRDGQGVGADEDSCDVSGGRWFDPLSGETVTLDEVEPQEFLPTERVWASGGSMWTEYQFSIYTTSPESVMTISKESYKERGQRGPDQWRPDDKGLWCGYALRWVSEKNTFGLSMESQAEADALTEMLDTCPDEGFTPETA